MSNSSFGEFTDSRIFFHFFFVSRFVFSSLFMDFFILNWKSIKRLKTETPREHRALGSGLWNARELLKSWKSNKVQSSAETSFTLPVGWSSRTQFSFLKQSSESIRATTTMARNASSTWGYTESKASESKKWKKTSITQHWIEKLKREARVKNMKC